MDAVEFLLKNGADVNTKNSKNFTLLMYCAIHGDIKLLDLVIKHGASINMVDFNGYTALDYATTKNNLEIVQCLVENGANLTDSSYMIALENKFRLITQFFDQLDPNKTIFMKK